jgi:hypothetical protein
MEEDGGISKLECFIRFDEVNYWLSRTPLHQAPAIELAQPRCNFLF